MKNVIYVGLRDPDGQVRVYIDGDKFQPLATAGEIPFDWGNTSPGARLLSLTILTHFLDDPEAAGRLVEQLFETTVSRFRPGEFVLLNWQIAEILEGVTPSLNSLKI